MTARRAYLFGHPVKHSVSPPMHNAAFAQLGINGCYELRDVRPEELPTAVRLLREPEALGANVTVPHKRAVMALLDRLDGQAEVIGAVNTIRNEDGVLVGYNSDAVGFLRGLEEAEFDPRNTSVALIGAGGASRAVASALLTANVAELFVFNRHAERALELARDLVVGYGARPVWGLPLTGAHLADLLARCTLLVNSTPVGMSSDETPVPPHLLHDRLLVVDIVYNPPRTRLLSDAEAIGARTQNGLPMLVHQAAAAFTLWTGCEAPVEEMRAAAERALRS